jgi:predicted dehydrogenase
MADIRWGILGCGHIAEKFAVSLAALDEGQLVAGASRTPGKAAAFGEKYGFDRVYESYEALVADPEVDAVYVATTHNFHYENARLCLGAGKAVLCEKPMTVNAAQSKELIELAREKGLFLMEAVWTRFLPAILKMQDLLASGLIGEVTTVHCDFGIAVECDDSHRLRNPDLAGGALLDLGIYPITFAAVVFGRAPDRISGSAILTDQGVDERSFYFLEYGEKQRAILSSSFTEKSPIEAKVYGTKGVLRARPPFLGVTVLEIYKDGADEPEIHEFPCPDQKSFKYEIAEAMACISDGKIESDIMPHDETLSVMKTMDALRGQWGMTYPGE